LFKEGDQLPEIEFKEVVGKAFIADPAHMALMGLNVGVTFGFTIKVPFTFVVPFQNPPPVVLYPP